MKHRRRPRRNGYTLIEVIAMIVVGAALMGIASMLLAGILLASSGNTQAVARQQTMLRLAQAWRDDVHRARSIVVKTAADNEDFDAAARLGDVEYHTSQGQVTRTETVAGEVVSQEEFRLLERESVTFLSDEEAGTATLRVQRDGEAASAARKNYTWEILAATGLNLRYQEAAP